MRDRTVSVRDLTLVILPLIILWLLVPVLKTPTVSNALKGFVIGIYMSISIISLMNIRRAGRGNH